mmetsp:Transcript_1725/g.3440  ORF Transcript_1725/g.3440 Transcript_1725/m.3440 type:complete len:148 (-) Transcript_1725:1474-1917(-)
MGWDGMCRMCRVAPWAFVRFLRQRAANRRVCAVRTKRAVCVGCTVRASYSRWVDRMLLVRPTVRCTGNRRPVGCLRAALATRPNQTKPNQTNDGWMDGFSRKASLGEQTLVRTVRAVGYAVNTELGTSLVDGWMDGRRRRRRAVVMD